MNTGAYYNECDPAAAAWLRELIRAGLVAPGIVDERSIEDVTPDDLRGFTQCHFFAGIGVWSYSLRLAGWPDDRPVWTGSCPCQPFSSAGKGGGFDDERHLWPAFHWLIAQCRPAVVFGEQVASKAVEPWIDLVHADVEALGYAFGCVPFPSAGVGSTLGFRQADATGSSSASSRLEHAQQPGLERLAGNGDDGHQPGRQRAHAAGSIAEAGSSGGMADAKHAGHGGQEADAAEPGSNRPGDWLPDGSGGGLCSPGPVNSHWRAADWLLCRDGKWRPVEPGLKPLVDGTPARVGRLRGYGNAINALAAAEFIRAAKEAM